MHPALSKMAEPAIDNIVNLKVVQAMEITIIYCEHYDYPFILLLLFYFQSGKPMNNMERQKRQNLEQHNKQTARRWINDEMCKKHVCRYNTPKLVFLNS